MRSSWLILSSADEDRIHPGPQDWKDFLNFKVGRLLDFVAAPAETPVDSKPAPKRRRTASPSAIDVSFPKVKGSLPIQWKGAKLTESGNRDNLEAPVSPEVFRQVVWDLIEHNFRFELLSLDRAIHPRRYMTPPDSLHRDTLVSACIPGRSLVMKDFPNDDFGLGASSVEKRWKYVEALRVVMLTWPGPSAGALLRMKLTCADQALCAKVEAVAYPFYCQTFFDYFGRAATVPHQLPV